MTKTDDYPDHTGTAGTVEVGGFATGEIETVGDVDWFAVEFEAEVEYRIDVLGSPAIDGALRNPYLVGIYSSSGNRIANTTNDDSGGIFNSRVDFEAPTGGIYYIAVRSDDGGTGTYRVHVSAPVAGDDYTAGDDTTGVVEVGGFATGNLETFGDQDWFAVELLAGTHYRIDLMGASTFAGTLANPYISGIWFGSTKLADSDDDNGGKGFDSRLSNFRVTEDGTYHIAVSHSGFPIGTYRLSVTETDLLAITKRNATDIEVDGGATGGIEQSGERDWFEIDLVGGNSYWIDIKGARTGAGTLRDPYLWGIYKADGTWIPGTEKNDGGVGYNTRLGFVPEEDGTYYIATAGNAHYTGTYRLTYSGVPMVGKVDVPISGTADQLGGFANVWYDISTGSNWIPFIGGGIGFVRVDQGDLDYNSNTLFRTIVAARAGQQFARNLPPVPEISTTDTVFAYHFSAGVGYRLTHNVILQASYRFQSASDLEFEAKNDTGTRPPAARKVCRGPLRAIRGFRAAHPRRRC